MVIKESAVILAKIKKAQKILLILHHSPDGDSFGSNLALLWYFKMTGKDCTLISGDTNAPENFQCLPGFKYIEDKNIFQINPNDYDLFIVLDASSPDQISKLKDPDLSLFKDVVVIDHHKSNIKYGSVNLIKNISSTSEIIYNLLRNWKANIDENIAACLFVGIYTDTGGFKYELTDINTFSTVGKLVKVYPRFSKLIFEIENQTSPGQLKYIALAYESIENFFSNNVAISAISSKQLAKKGLSNKDTSGGNIANDIKSVVGWNIGISMTEKEKNKTMCSFRTRDPEKFDLTKIVKKLERKYGEGGGHPAAAGAAIYLPVNKAKKYILKIIGEVYPDLKG